jgi:hypothetical protein
MRTIRPIMSLRILRMIYFVYIHSITTYRIIFWSYLSPYIDEIIWDHQCEFQRNRSATDQIFCIRQILGKKWEYNETVHTLFIDYDSVRREVLYNILLELHTHTPAQEKQVTHTITKQYKVQNTTAAPEKEKSKQ